LVDSGWSRIEIPDVSSNISRNNLQLTINKTGMVTLVWYSAQRNSFNIDINAKHFMTSSSWSATDTLSVPADTIIKPYNVDDSGVVHVAWLVASNTVGAYDMKMAAYTPMQGWSGIIDGPAGIGSHLATLSVSGNHKVVAVTSVSSDTVDAYVEQDDGSWAPYNNINQHQDGDGVELREHEKTLIRAGGNDHFLIAWRERANVNGVFEYRYRSVMLHYMTDAMGMVMWHVENPSQLNGLSSQYESHLDYVLDQNGKAYAAWTAVDYSDNSDNVYVNSASMDAGWNSTAERLASYDMNAGDSAGAASIAINSKGDVGVAWDQHHASATQATHTLWYAQNNLPQ